LRAKEEDKEKEEEEEEEEGGGPVKLRHVRWEGGD